MEFLILNFEGHSTKSPMSKLFYLIFWDTFLSLVMLSMKYVWHTCKYSLIRKKLIRKSRWRNKFQFVSSLSHEMRAMDDLTWNLICQKILLLLTLFEKETGWKIFNLLKVLAYFTIFFENYLTKNSFKHFQEKNRVKPQINNLSEGKTP